MAAGQSGHETTLEDYVLLVCASAPILFVVEYFMGMSSDTLGNVFFPGS